MKNINDIGFSVSDRTITVQSGLLWKANANPIPQNVTVDLFSVPRRLASYHKTNDGWGTLTPLFDGSSYDATICNAEAQHESADAADLENDKDGGFLCAVLSELTMQELYFVLYNCASHFKAVESAKSDCLRQMKALRQTPVSTRHFTR
jgi:hypothetical protein